PRPNRQDLHQTHVIAVSEGSDRQFILELLAGGRVQQASVQRKPFCGPGMEGTIWNFPEACARREDWWFGSTSRSACRTHRGHPYHASRFEDEHGCRRLAAESHRPDGSSDNAAT